MPAGSALRALLRLGAACTADMTPWLSLHYTLRARSMPAHCNACCGTHSHAQLWARHMHMMPSMSAPLLLAHGHSWRSCGGTVSSRDVSVKATKTRREHCCSDCGYSSIQYFGVCPNCQQFGTCVLQSFGPYVSHQRSCTCAGDACCPAASEHHADLCDDNARQHESVLAGAKRSPSTPDHQRPPGRKPMV